MIKKTLIIIGGDTNSSQFINFIQSRIASCYALSEPNDEAIDDIREILINEEKITGCYIIAPVNDDKPSEGTEQSIDVAFNNKNPPFMTIFLRGHSPSQELTLQEQINKLNEWINLTLNPNPSTHTPLSLQLSENPLSRQSSIKNNGK